MSHAAETVTDQQTRNAIRKHKPTITTLVTRPRGSWKYQNSYAIATYRLQVLLVTGDPLWVYVERSPRYSMPQLKRYGKTWQHVGRPTQELAREVIANLPKRRK